MSQASTGKTAPRSTPLVGGIVLCGGKSSRMGRPKAWLPLGHMTFLERVVAVLQEVVSPVVVVAAPRQDLPPLPDDVCVVRDEREGLGPLGGLYVGLSALKAAAAFITACDTPLLQPAFVQALIDRLGTHELVIPREGGFHHPLAAVYRVGLVDRVRALLDADRLRPFYLLEQADTLEVEIEELRSADPQLLSLRNTNTPDEYDEVLRLAALLGIINDPEAPTP